ncbi:MAG: hypothetical protein ACLP0J_15055 [Solirubrobacteraceae bacterium]|jgi:hypothetical protein
MTDPSVSPAPLVEQALQSLRDNAPERTRSSGDAAKRTPTQPASDAPIEPDRPRTKAAPKTQARPDRARVKRDLPGSKIDAAPTDVEADAESNLPLDRPTVGASASLDSALDALRTVSASAQTRLADPEAFPDLPIERDLSDLGPYVEHVMREAQAAAAAYREEAARETTARAAKLLGEATASAEKVRHDADAYGERALAQADALLAERVYRIAELTGRLSQMAQRAGDEFAGDQIMRDQMMQFISGLTAAAEEAVTEVFPNTPSSSQTPHTDGARPRRKVRS